MAVRSRPRRSAGNLYHLRLPRLLFLLPLALLLILFLAHLPALLRGANAHGRQCLPAGTDRLLPFPHPVRDPRLSLAIVTLADEDAGRPGWRRSFRGVLAASARNKRAYAAAHGYGLVALPASAVDPSRPPSWSKVLALRTHLRHHHWLFWNDADTLVTNPDIPLDRILFSVIGHNDFDESPDLVLTEDFGGVNAGVFFIRRSKWSEKFLDTWWNQTLFIQFGSTRSGDNAALKHLIDHLSAEEMQEHVRIAKMQCLFNSYPWTLTLKSVHRLIFHLPTTWKGVYSDGDFMVHFAGLDDKQGWTNKILREREEVKDKLI
ncbi:probable alpha-1,6-mannosyltransferase MNN10 [Miscanthus floridulus]|uniref:probable alpha-1,6-mannosyltransferase MNN10 n=1 Tax=Miscanthus floridulus TaxID=154761 RepID=UPI00345A12FE